MGPARLPLADLAQASVVSWEVSWGPAVVWGRGSDRAVWFSSSSRLARAHVASAGLQGLLRWGLEQA